MLPWKIPYVSLSCPSVVNPLFKCTCVRLLQFEKTPYATVVTFGGRVISTIPVYAKLNPSKL